MSAMERHAVEARFLAADRGGNEVVAQPVNFTERQRPGASFLIVRRAHRFFSTQPFGRSHAGMVKLADSNAIVALDFR